MKSSNNYFELIEWLNQNIDWNNQILKGSVHDVINIDGVVKPSISRSINESFLAFNSLVSGRQAFRSKSEMLSSGTPSVDKLLAEVWGDGENNGLYGWTGSGGWLRSDYDLHAKVGRLSDGSKRLWYVDGKPICGMGG